VTAIQRFSRTKFALLCASSAICLLRGGALLAQSGGATATEMQVQTLRKGSVEVGGLFGTTLPVSWLRAHADRRLTLGAFDVGRVMTGRLGHGPLAGHFEFLLEAAPMLAVQQPGRTLGVAVSPLHMRWNFAPARTARVRAFAEASGGIVYTNHPVPVRATTRVNFIDQAGFGLRFETGAKRAWLAGYRFQHISNAGRAVPNPGANFNFFYGGVMFLR
jgi:Lipid A 3-O-deacylase (PagL)